VEEGEGVVEGRREGVEEDNGEAVMTRGGTLEFVGEGVALGGF
jgi:hypothetical protein